eukprot:scaffold772_cov339-Pavlova_lutheri.AAC.79
MDNVAGTRGEVGPEHRGPVRVLCPGWVKVQRTNRQRPGRSSWNMRPCDGLPNTDLGPRVHRILPCDGKRPLSTMDAWKTKAGHEGRARFAPALALF